MVVTSRSIVGNSGRTLCTNAINGKYYVGYLALFNASSSATFNNARIISIPVWDGNNVGMYLIQAINDGTITCTTSGTVNAYGKPIELDIE